MHSARAEGDRPMGHLYLFCGPPGAGKTTLLKLIKKSGVEITQLKRLTTRKPREEEGDNRVESSEYYFRTPEEFAERLLKGNVANLIEWNGNYYATQFSELDKSLTTNGDYILLEDIPTAIALEEKLNGRVTVIFVFTGDRNEVLNNMEFASHKSFSNEFLSEWKRRLGLKYNNSMKIENKEPTESGREQYIERKLNRAIPDLAFVIGKLRDNRKIFVLANRRDKLEEAVNSFITLTKERRNTLVVEPATESSGPDLDPGSLKIGFIFRSMTAAQFWKIATIFTSILSAVAVAAYTLGKGIWP
jgi:guanylate kinase